MAVCARYKVPVAPDLKTNEFSAFTVTDVFSCNGTCIFKGLEIRCKPSKLGPVVICS